MAATASRAVVPPPPPPSSPPKQPRIRALVRAAKTMPTRLKSEETMLSLESHSFQEMSHLGLKVSADRPPSHLQRAEHEPDIFLTNQSINTYAKCGDTDAARDVFDRTRRKNTVTWNAMIAGYCSNRRFLDALSLFGSMIESGFAPDHVTYLSALRAAAGSRHFAHGQQVHTRVVKTGIARVEVGNALVNMYAKFGRPDEAETVGDTMVVERDDVTWNSLVAANAKNGRHDRALALLVEMLRTGLEPNEFTFGSLFGSDDVHVVKALHSQAVRIGLASNVVIGSAILDAYARCREPRDAMRVFGAMPERNVVTWNSAVAACFDNDMAREGLRGFLRMGESGLLPDEYTVSILLKAASVHLAYRTGKQLHGLAIKLGRHADTSTANLLIVMYAKMESVSDSWKIFKNISDPDLVSWNSMAQAYVTNDQFERALALFVEMKASGFQPDRYSFASAFVVCASLGLYGTGRAVHCDLIKSGLAPDAFLGSTMIEMYTKSACITEAKSTFDGIESKNLITWNSMMAALAQSGTVNEVLSLLCLMNEQDRLEPDGFTFASVLSACAKATALPQGRQVHAAILKSANLDMDTAVTNAMITMYSKAGCITEAEAIFSGMADKNVISWTSMIGAYASSGHSTEAVKAFEAMEKSGVAPNDKTFVALLTACSHGGMTKEACEYFDAMATKYAIEPAFDHYACMVDTLGRAGRLAEAEGVVEAMPCKPNAVVWKSLLSACRVYRDRDRGRRCMERIVALNPTDSAAYVLLSNLYAELGDSHSVAAVRQLMRDNGAAKEPGKSWIQVADTIHEFVSRDVLHPRRDDIYLNLKILHKHMKDEE